MLSAVWCNKLQKLTRSPQLLLWTRGHMTNKGRKGQSSYAGCLRPLCHLVLPLDCLYSWIIWKAGQGVWYLICISLIWQSNPMSTKASCPIILQEKKKSSLNLPITTLLPNPMGICNRLTWSSQLYSTLMTIPFCLRWTLPLASLWPNVNGWIIVSDISPCPASTALPQPYHGQSELPYSLTVGLSKWLIGPWNELEVAVY